MIKLDEDSFICDMAETYHIYDYKQFPATYIAKLAFGLPEKSRIKRAMNKIDITLEEMLLMAQTDALNLLVWMRTKDAVNGFNKPESLLKQALGIEEEKKYASFESPEEFEREWEEKNKGEI